MLKTKYTVPLELYRWHSNRLRSFGPLNKILGRMNILRIRPKPQSEKNY